MTVVDSAATPAQTATTVGPITTASFTPTAGAMLIALVAIGNSSGAATAITGAITDSLSRTWTLACRINTSGDGSAEIWTLNNVAATSCTVTLTNTGGTICKGSQLSVRQCTGQSLTQTGAAKPTTSGTIGAISITPSQIGSQLYCVLSRNAGSVARTINGTSTVILSTQDATNGETYNSAKATSLTPSLTAVSVGFTTTGSATLIAGIEVIPASGPVTNNLTVTATPTSTAGLTRGAAKRFAAAVTSTASTITEWSVRVVGSGELGSVLSVLGRLVPGGVPPSSSFYNQTSAASAMSTGALKRSTGKIVATSTTSTAVLARGLRRTVTASAVSTAALIRQAGRTIQAAVTSTGTLARQFPKTVTGTATSAGTVLTPRGLARTFTAASTSTAGLVRQVQRTISAVPTSTVLVARRISRTISAPVTSTGAATAIRVHLLAVAATVTSAGAMVRQIAKTIVAPVAGIGAHKPRLLQRPLIPAYFYPFTSGSQWLTLNATPPPNGAGYVIADIASGPGTTINSDYTTAITNAQAAGWTVLGYVDTDYATVLTATVETNIGYWQSLYGITSIFFDRADTTSGNIGYYTTLTAYVHGNTGISVLNWGTAPDPGYLSLTVCDAGVVFENTYTAWQSSPPANYSSAPIAVGVIVYGVPAGAAAAVIEQSAGLGAGWVDVTDEPDDNFAALPAYFGWEVQLLASTAKLTLAATKTLGAAAASTVGLVRSIARKLTAAATSTGATTAIRVHLITILTTVTSTVTVASRQALARTITAAVTSTSALTRHVARTVTAAATSTTTLGRSIGRSIAAAVTSTGVITAIRVNLVTVTAAAASTANVIRRVGRTLNASVTSSPALIRRVVRTVTAAASSTAGVARQTAKRIVATVVSAVTAIATEGAVTYNQTAAAVATTTTSLKRSVGKFAAAAATSNSLIVRALTRTVTTTATTAATAAKGLARLVTALVTSAGNLTWTSGNQTPSFVVQVRAQQTTVAVGAQPTTVTVQPRVLVVKAGAVSQLYTSPSTVTQAQAMDKTWGVDCTNELSDAQTPTIVSVTLTTGKTTVTLTDAATVTGNVISQRIRANVLRGGNQAGYQLTVLWTPSGTTDINCDVLQITCPF